MAAGTGLRYPMGLVSLFSSNGRAVLASPRLNRRKPRGSSGLRRLLHLQTSPKPVGVCDDLQRASKILDYRPLVQLDPEPVSDPGAQVLPPPADHPVRRCTTLRRESRSTTLSSRRSTPGSGTSALTKRSSARSPRLAPSSSAGGAITTRSDHTPRMRPDASRGAPTSRRRPAPISGSLRRPAASGRARNRLSNQRALRMIEGPAGSRPDGDFRSFMDERARLIHGALQKLCKGSIA